MIFFSGEVAFFVLLRGCVILCVERLREFFVWRGFVIFFTYSGCMIYVSGGCDIFFAEG